MVFAPGVTGRHSAPPNRSTIFLSNRALRKIEKFDCCMGRSQWYKIPASARKRRMFITRKSPPLPAQAEQKIGVEGDRCLRLRFRLDQRIAMRRWNVWRVP